MQLRMNRNTKFAFTLAEVLITLAVIGVVAAMSIPNMQVKFRKQATITQLKETYSLLNQILLQAAAENGTTLNSLFDYGTIPTTQSNYQTVSTNFFNSYVAPYVRIGKDCKNNVGNACEVSEKYELDKSIANELHGFGHEFYLTNGVYLKLIPDNAAGYLKGMIFLFDINGDKPPNTYGKDIFQARFYTYSSRIAFYGFGNARDTLLNNAGAGCNTSASGGFCGALIQQDNWEIKSDYPW